MRRIVIGVLVMVLAAGCSAGSGTPSSLGASGNAGLVAASVAPWPALYQSQVCAALTALSGSASHFSALSRAAAAMDLATVTSESAAIAAASKKAQDDLVGVPSWAPGTDLLRQLNAAVANYRKAANEFQLGVSGLDASLVSAGVTLMSRGNGQTKKATADLTSLHDNYGFGCP
jgi:hypothetical protein